MFYPVTGFKFSFSIALLMLALTNFGNARDLHQDSTWTPKDIIMTEYVNNAAFSPDGKMIVWSKNVGLIEEDKFVHKLFLTRLDVLNDAYKTVQLTYGKEDDHDAIFSRNDEKIYFLSSREEGKYLWAMSIYGGEPDKVHQFDDGISDLKWLNDSTLLFLATEGKTLYEKEHEKDNTEVIEDESHWKPERIFKYDIKNDKVVRLTDNQYPVSNYQVSDDGRFLITTLTMSLHYEADAHPKQQIFLYDLVSGTRRQILQDLQTPGDFKFARHDKAFYFTADRSSDPEWNGAGVTELYFYSIPDTTATKVNLHWPLGLSGEYFVLDEGMLVSLANKALRKVSYYQKNGLNWIGQDIGLDSLNGHVSLLATDRSGDRTLLSYSTIEKLPEYLVFDINRKRGKILFAAGHELAGLNENLKSKPTAKSAVVRWRGARNDLVEGLLYYPAGYEKGKRYPLVLIIHGGPNSVDLDEWRERWSTYPQIYAQKGAFVLRPNYHGSSNYGLDFVESIKGHYYELEVVDIVNGIHHLDSLGLIDTTQMGVLGWSNGAILTTKLIVEQPDMFKAAAPGAGDVNWTSDFGTCQFGVSFDESYFIGAPWDDVDGHFYNPAYIEKSPLFEIEKIKTPTIIFQGSKDRAVPRDQSWEYYRGLQQVGKAPVKFLWFPDQPHGLQKITHQMRKMNEEITWFDQYLFKKDARKNEAFKNDSPLARLLTLDSVAAHDGFYGVWKNDHLLPELAMIKADSISIGRFEVTNAQYHSFDSTYQYQLLKANYPVVDLNQEQISGYLKWLTAQTGKIFRLPNKLEGEALKEKAFEVAKNENVLNYWAGYDITLDEVKLFEKKIVEAKGSLIMRVGQFRPVSIGQAKIYDLGGNVSEYYLDGTILKIYGYAAYDYVDAMNPDREGSSFTGFRVIAQQ